VIFFKNKTQYKSSKCIFLFLSLFPSLFLPPQGSLHSRSVSHIQAADLGYLKKTQIQWERRIQKSLNSTCSELNIPLARIRSTTDRDELAEKWNELSTYDMGKYYSEFERCNSSCTLSYLGLIFRFITISTTVCTKGLSRCIVLHT